MDNGARSQAESWPGSDVLRQIVKAVGNVRFGRVEIIIQDPRVVQIETTEKIRLA